MLGWSRWFNFLGSSFWSSTAIQYRKKQYCVREHNCCIFWKLEDTYFVPLGEKKKIISFSQHFNYCTITVDYLTNALLIKFLWQLFMRTYMMIKFACCHSRLLHIHSEVIGRCSVFRMQHLGSRPWLCRQIRMRLPRSMYIIRTQWYQWFLKSKRDGLYRLYIFPQKGNMDENTAEVPLPMQTA